MLSARVIVSMAALAVACSAQKPVVTPRQTLDEYAAALVAGDPAHAYALLSSESKKDITFKEFKKILSENPEEVKELARSLSSPTGEPLVTARVSAPDGQTLLMVYEGGAWRVDGAALDLYGQATPKKAVAAFIRAFENDRFDILMRFVPDSQRSGLTEKQLRTAWKGEQGPDIERKVAALKVSLRTAKIELLGRRATLAYGAGGSVELVREHGAWKIEELE